MQKTIKKNNDWLVEVWDHVKGDAETLAGQTIFGKKTAAEETLHWTEVRLRLRNSGDARSVMMNVAHLDPCASSIPKDVVSLSKALKAEKFNFYPEKVTGGASELIHW